MKSDEQLRQELGLPPETPEQRERRRRKAILESRTGMAVNHRNELVPIAGAFHRIEDGRPVCDVPLRQREPLRGLRSVSIAALIETDGDVPSAESKAVV